MERQADKHQFRKNSTSQNFLEKTKSGDRRTNYPLFNTFQAVKKSFCKHWRN